MQVVPFFCQGGNLEPVNRCRLGKRQISGRDLLVGEYSQGKKIVTLSPITGTFLFGQGSTEQILRFLSQRDGCLNIFNPDECREGTQLQ